MRSSPPARQHFSPLIDSSAQLFSDAAPEGTRSIPVTGSQPSAPHGR